MRRAPSLDEAERAKGAMVAGQFDPRLQFDAAACRRAMACCSAALQQAAADATALIGRQHSQLAEVEMVGLLGDEGAADDRVAGLRQEADLGRAPLRASVSAVSRCAEEGGSMTPSI